MKTEFLSVSPFLSTCYIRPGNACCDSFSLFRSGDTHTHVTRNDEIDPEELAKKWKNWRIRFGKPLYNYLIEDLSDYVR